MLRSLNLRWKIMLILVLVVPVLLGITLYQTQTLSQLMRSSVEARALEMAHRYANKIDVEMSEAMVTARIMARMYEGLAGTDNPPARQVYLDTMQGMLSDNDEFLGVYVAFEPGALDGKDAEYANAPGHAEDGGFRPWIYRDGGKISMQPSLNPTDPDDPNLAWYYLPKKTQQEVMMEPWAYDINGKSVLMVDMIVPIIQQGKFIGVAGVDYPMDTVDSYVRNIKVLDSGYAVLLSHAGRYIAHPESEKYVAGGLNIFEQKDTPEVLVKGLKDKVLKGSVFTMYSQGEKGEMLSVYAPVTVGRSTSPYIFGLHIPMDEMLAEVSHQRNLTLAVSCAAIVLIVLFILYIARTIDKPLRETVAALDTITGGDLSVRLPAASKDEIGRMQGAVNNMAAELQYHMDDISRQKAIAEEKSQQAEKAKEEAENACLQAESAQKEGRQMAARRLEEIVSHIFAASEDVSRQASEIRSGTETQRERITSTATAMEEMNATVLEVARNAGETAEQATHSKDNALDGVVVVGKSMKAMGNI